MSNAIVDVLGNARDFQLLTLSDVLENFKV